MTRLVKDVLRVGRWKVDHDRHGKPVYWNVTHETLREIAHQLRLAQARGVAMNIGKSHGDLRTGLIPTDELISPIDEAVVEGDTLWISTYVTPGQARYLRNPARKVSPGIRGNWEDGLGNVYPIQMVHVAVTDNPVVVGQGPFMALANRPPQQGKGKSMPKTKSRRQSRRLSQEQLDLLDTLGFNLANDDEDDQSEASEDGDGASSMEADRLEGPGVSHLIELVDEILEDAYGVHLPEGETGDSLVHDLEVITETLGVGNGEVEEEDDESPELLDDEEDLPLSLSNYLKRRTASKNGKGRKPATSSGARHRESKSGQIPSWAADLVNSVNDLAGQVKNLSNDRQLSKRAEFLKRLKAAGKSGVPSKSLVKLERLGEKHGYDLSLLDVLDGVGRLDLNNSRAGRHASAKHPRINVPTSQLTDEEVEEAAGILTGKGRNKAAAKNGKA